MEWRRTLACILILLATLFAGFVAGSPNPDANCENTHASNESGVGLAAQSPNHSPNRPQEANCDSPHWYTALKRPEWLSLIVASIGIIIIAWQSLETRKAAEGASQASKAALQQASYMVNSERAWLLLERIDAPHLVPLEESLPKEQRFTHCIVWIKNYGSTPGRILAVWAEMRINRSIDEPPSESPPEYSQVRPIEETYVFPPDKEQPYEARLMPNGIIGRPERDAVRYGSEFLWLRGCVKYCDVLSPDISKHHETWFCYRYETRTNSIAPFWMPGPTKCNKAN